MANRLALLFFVSVGILGYCWYLSRQWMSGTSFGWLVGGVVLIGAVGGAIWERWGSIWGANSTKNSSLVVAGAASAGVILQAIAPVWLTTLAAASLLCVAVGAITSLVLGWLSSS